MPKISVIMPCLNMENYIEESIRSVLNQTLKDIEVLVIDAGSTDGTLKILDRIAKYDNRLRVVNSSKKSYGFQINLGCKLAAGKYIAFVDTDDYVEPEMYEELFEIAEEEEADYVKGAPEYFWEIRGKYRLYVPVLQFNTKVYKDGRYILNPQEDPLLMTKDFFLWEGIYRLDFWKKISLHETPGARYQDTGGLISSMRMANKAVFVPKTYYKYRQDNMKASGYDKKGFGYTIAEYDYWLNEMGWKREEKKWLQGLYGKWCIQIIAKMQVMASSGRFWDESREDIQTILSRFREAKEQGYIVGKLLPVWVEAALDDFLGSPYRLYTKFETASREGKEEVKKLIELLKREKKIVIFGAGKNGRIVALMMLNKGIKSLVGFCDNKLSDNYKTLYDLPVFSVDDAVERYRDAVFLVASPNYNQEMVCQLEESGIAKKQIVSLKGNLEAECMMEN